MNTRRLVVAAALVLATTRWAGASSVLGLSIEDQARLSKHVVVGTITGQQGVEHPDQGLETAVTLVVAQALKGDLKAGDTLVFHTRSGQLDGESSEAIGEATFQTGQKALVFLEEIDGRLYNLGLSMGVWDVHTDRSGQTTFTRALRDGLHVVGDVVVESGPVRSNVMKSRIASAVREPAFDHPMLRESLGTGR